MMYYAADERAREMEMGAAERQTGCSCSPLGRMISRVIKRCNGRGGRGRNKERLDYAMAYAPAQTCYMRPTARTVTFAAGGNSGHHPAHAHGVPPEPATTLPGKPRKSKKKKKRVRFTTDGSPAPGAAPPPHTAYAPQHTAPAASAGDGAAAASAYHRGAAAEPYYSPTPPASQGQGHGYAYGRYAPSPLPRWETVGTPRRHEYFSGEYRWYYPTPVREGIYSMATDANRLTAIFSEENPNACTIV